MWADLRGWAAAPWRSYWAGYSGKFALEPIAAAGCLQVARISQKISVRAVDGQRETLKIHDSRRYVLDIAEDLLAELSTEALPPDESPQEYVLLFDNSVSDLYLRNSRERVFFGTLFR